MTARTSSSLTLLATVCAALGASNVYGAEFTLLPIRGGGSTAWEPRGISADGRLVAGGYEVSFLTGAFRWTPVGGFLELPGFPGLPFPHFAYDVSGDGTQIFGVAKRSGGNGNPEPVRWSVDGEISALDPNSPPPYGVFQARGASFDGSAVVGDYPFYWRADGGYSLPLAPPGQEALSLDDISADGSAFVGTTFDPVTGRRNVSLWTEAGAQAVTLPRYDELGWELAAAISADGGVSTGFSFLGPSGTVGLRWEGTATPTVLGAFKPAGISGDGNIIVGEGYIWLEGAAHSICGRTWKVPGST
jgi:hypothetical protein